VGSHDRHQMASQGRVCMPSSPEVVRAGRTYPFAVDTSKAG
jgi:hypothetical protein